MSSFKGELTAQDAVHSPQDFFTFLFPLPSQCPFCLTYFYFRSLRKNKTFTNLLSPPFPQVLVGKRLAACSLQHLGLLADQGKETTQNQILYSFDSIIWAFQELHLSPPPSAIYASPKCCWSGRGRRGLYRKKQSLGRGRLQISLIQH